MVLRRLPLFASVALILVLASPPSARSDVVCKDGEATVNRQISRGDFNRLVQCFDTLVKKRKTRRMRMARRQHFFLCPLARFQWVLFDSEGGDVNEAIKIGRFLRAALAKVHVSGTGSCFSACFLAVTGAIEIYSGTG